MTTHLTGVPALVAAFALMALTGLLLSRTAPAYGTALLTVHKLAALVVVAALVLRVRAAHLDATLSAGAWAVAVAAGLLLVAGIATGGLLSALDHAPAVVAVAHRFVPVGVVALVATTVAVVPLPAR
jgi:hypothetical protein